MPKFNQKKAVLQNYLTQHNIPFSAIDTKKLLYEKIKQKKTPVVYKIDKIANLHGYKVIRTPVRHWELNPIELIWAQLKGFVAKNNTTFRIKDAAFGKNTKYVWTKAEYVVKIEKEYCRENCIDRNVIEPITIDFCDDDSDDDAG